MISSKILIVDDEIIIARELEARLKGMGYEIPAIASSGAEAIRLAEETQADLVLMDIVLKGDMDGIEAAMEIRRRRHVPIIYVTAYTDKRTLERARITEPFGYIVKPFSERELNANIEMALYKHSVESRFRKVERWFITATEEIADAVIATNGDGMVTIFNTAAGAITGWSKEEAVGRKLQDVFRLVSRHNGAPISLDGAAEAPVVCLAEDTLLVDRFSKEIPIDSTTSCIRDGDDRPTGTVSVFRDISGQRPKALMALNADVVMASAQAVTIKGMLRLCAESIVRNLEVTLARIWTLNSTGELLTMEASAGITTELDRLFAKVPLGKTRIGMIAKERKPHLSSDLQNDFEVIDPEWVRRERIVSFAGYPLVVDERLVGVIGICSRHPLSGNVLDILGSVASTMALGIERKRLEEQLRQSQKMEAIGQFAGGIAHDFNNLLTVISGYSQILLRKNPENENSPLIKQIVDAGDRAASLTRQLLAFSRKQVLEPRVLDLNALIANMENMLQRLIGENIIMATALDPMLASVTADPGQLEQVIVNLAVNAGDAMPQGGRLTIETRNIELDASYLSTHPMAGPGEYVLLAVSDTGCGMTPDMLNHIFEPFFTTKGPGKGTGLGLATVYGIVRQSGGRVEVYSEPEIGTTFKIYLPRTRDADGGSKAPPSQGGVPHGTETILLVEDEQAVRALARYILQECGYTVLEASNGNDALAIAEQHQGRLHLLLTDVVLPGINGRILAERLVLLRPDITVLYTSGYTDDAVIRHGVLEAETAFIQKPFTPSALAGKVREVLDQAASASSAAP